MRILKCREAFDPSDLVLFEQEFDAARQLANGFVFLGHHRIQIEADLARLDPKGCHRAIMRFVEQFRSVEQRF